MKIQETKPEVQRAVRAIHDAFETIRKDNPGKRYSIGFALAIAEPMQNLTESEVASFIEVASRSVGQFSAASRITLQLDIVEYSDVASKIVTGAQKNFEESLKLEGKGPKLVADATPKDTAGAGA